MSEIFSCKRLTNGRLGSNTYILWDNATKETAIIDAGNSLESIVSVTEKNQLKVKYLILTHVHFDHICFLDDIRKYFKEAEVVCAKEEKEFFGNPNYNASLLFGSAMKFQGEDKTVNDGDILPLGSLETGGMKIILTPGHTPGSICILADDWMFTGDTLFYNNFGRTDLGAGSTEMMKKSIEKLYAMDPKIVIFPGHGIASSIGREEKCNPFMDF